MANIQPVISNVIMSLRRCLDNILGEKLYGLYLYGSAARGEFEPNTSDIDFIVVLNERLNSMEIDSLRTAHNEIGKEDRFGTKFDGMYLQLTDIGRLNEEIDKYPFVYQSEFNDNGYFDINYVTWWSLKTDGVPIDSPGISNMLAEIDWPSVETTLAYNLNEYWKDKADHEELFLEDIWVEFGVSTVSRIVYSLEEKAIISKTDACHYIAGKYPMWEDVTNESLRLRNIGSCNSFKGSEERKERVIDYIKCMIEKGNVLLSENCIPTSL